MQRMLSSIGRHTKLFDVAAGVIVALLMVPSLALAAYNDVNLTTNTILNVNGITLNVSGSTAVIQSITVNATSFTVVLPSGSNFEVTAPGLQRLTADTTMSQVKNICTSSQSILGYAPVNANVTVTITPSTTLACASSGSSSSSSGGGTNATPPAVPTKPAVAASGGLTSAQVTAILNVLASFNADAATMAKVQAALLGTGAPTTGSVTSTAVHVFKANLTIGSLGSEVKALQMFLNSHGYPIAAKGAGSPGHETDTFGAATRAALMKYQKAKGITPASGYFGPKTQAAVNAEK